MGYLGGLFCDWRVLGVDHEEEDVVGEKGLVEIGIDPIIFFNPIQGQGPIPYLPHAANLPIQQALGQIKLLYLIHIISW